MANNFNDSKKKKEILKQLKEIVEIHRALTLNGNDFFQLELLTFLEKERTLEKLEEFKEEHSNPHLLLHLNELRELGMIREIKKEKKRCFSRTEKGERALAILQGFRKKVGEKSFAKILKARLGSGSLGLFLRVYGLKRRPKFKQNKGYFIEFSPRKIGRVAQNLPNGIEAVSAIDRLDEAGLLIYQEEDNKIVTNCVESRAFFQYLERLEQLL